MRMTSKMQWGLLCQEMSDKIFVKITSVFSPRYKPNYGENSLSRNVKDCYSRCDFQTLTVAYLPCPHQILVKFLRRSHQQPSFYVKLLTDKRTNKKTNMGYYVTYGAMQYSEKSAEQRQKRLRCNWFSANCVSVLLYGFEAYPLNASDMIVRLGYKSISSETL